MTDALLLVSFGGPEKPDDVVPFLENVTRGRGIPRERLVEVGQHYFQFGGKSPINDQCRALKAAIEADFAARGVSLPVYWGNRNWDPYLADTLRQMRADGITSAACLFTSAYASYSGCRQYRENLAAAVAEVGEGAPELRRLPHYFNRPGFLEPFVDHTVAALAELPAGSRLEFVTHSIPTAMNDAAGPNGGAYVAEHLDAAGVIAAGVGERIGRPVEWELVYCSRSGPPSQPWLEPDVNDHLETLAKDGVPGVAVLPIGFVSDHMEVIYDLDTEAKATAEQVDLPFRRVPTPGVDPRFVTMVRELVTEAEPVVLGTIGPRWGDCPAGCCANLRGPQPALCGKD
ncbi:ferrochelatase [Tenggerimyces flavus]|uniref:Coproporphyrin III ferrochelatase n=1 Tax=Tenggerimyces flavus TaxID=1708749 RepID=A0ABV7YKA0_9ACTN|nr:ferrochelatase [Tenggerimyces flavus]MBM7787693.1 ferrochelatase [Tenggerimyces flavus]